MAKPPKPNTPGRSKKIIKSKEVKMGAPKKVKQGLQVGKTYEAGIYRGKTGPYLVFHDPSTKMHVYLSNKHAILRARGLGLPVFLERPNTPEIRRSKTPLKWNAAQGKLEAGEPFVKKEPQKGTEKIPRKNQKDPFRAKSQGIEPEDLPLLNYFAAKIRGKRFSQKDLLDALVAEADGKIAPNQDAQKSVQSAVEHFLAEEMDRFVKLKMTAKIPLSDREKEKMKEIAPSLLKALKEQSKSIAKRHENTWSPIEQQIMSLGL